ncbi:hypothetical protein HPP92_009619 [Vanilla planifolia]|uniref:heme oxygenase (biliverdin-producing) n=1 Tax=Vanilla planifolia TaxID=51239 RepID=A0A835V4V7_VANPL|nr:hypothetical protein HPP92_009619 [Vanilla planifolia]
MATEMPKERHAGEDEKGFVEEMRAVAMKLHTRDQAREGEKEPDENPISRTENVGPKRRGGGRGIHLLWRMRKRRKIRGRDAEFRNTGLERSEALANDLQWFEGQADMILNGKELEFYKWEGNLRKLLQNVKEKINKVAMEFCKIKNRPMFM